MKILAINNYSLKDSLLKSSKGLSPAHHNWGVDYLIEKGHEVEVLNLKSIGGIKGRIHNLFFCLSNLFYFNKFDVVIAFANPIIGFCALLKKVGLIRCKLYTFVHHSTKYMELYSSYNRIIFLSKQIMEITKKRHPRLSHLMIDIEWGPDLTFYEDAYQEIIKGNRFETVKLISNGKSHRDLDIINKTIIQKTNILITIITDKVYSGGKFSAITSDVKGVNAVSYSKLLKYMKDSNISIITIKKEIPTGSLCGLTSLLDAMALGQPIIMSDNTNISIDIETLKIGLVYKSGDESDFMNKLKYMIDHPDYMKICSNNARKYALEHSYNDYCKSLEKIILE